ncbi:GTP-binding protein HflX [Paenibacillus sp. UNCCL117]|uniref:GTPase HflX n=1 Tax=unclassified Paenibacillus TaxID=185978 RepID=UPI000891DBE8|nr:MULTISPECIES: GTPase HflX [unclassified Paenibacillus]SDD49065.1 GTP-binding protein HflX [Paenibacillus sp. cl123]SFW50085.1 GTP-binding protein HflX [Paenibacillus sp. UNCCL117]
MEQPQQKAIIVGIQLQHQTDFAYSMEELRNLAAACQVEVVGELSQKLERINPSHYIGSGKIEELKTLLEESDAATVICNDELSPSQIRNLEAALACKVIDRTILILDIFAERAQTREAQLQVEVAQLQYMLPRLVGLRASLGRQGGGGGAGFKNRGSGETKLELDRRRIEERISILQTELEKLVARRQTQRKQRHKNEIPVVCLVGYTNAGKSSLMNAVIEAFHPGSGKQVLAKDMLFATLETSVRSIELPDHKSFLLTDTVGFVSQLPHHLVKAFRSTLEEVAEADLLIHVVDVSNPEYEQQIAVTEDTLKQLGADQIPMIYAYNKADLTEYAFPQTEENRVYLSARLGQGIEELTGLIRDRIFQGYVQCEIIIPYDQGRLVSYFNEHALVHATSYEENGTKLELECKAADLEKYKDALIRL